MEGAYRWSPEIEAQFLSLMKVGCRPSVVAEQIGCSERMARRLVMRWKAGLTLVTKPAPPPSTKAKLTPGKKRPGRPSGKWADRIATMPQPELEMLRFRAIQRATEGRSAEYISQAVKAPLSVIEEWIDGWDGEPITLSVETPVEAPDEEPEPVEAVEPSEWPPSAVFDECPKAARCKGSPGPMIVGFNRLLHYTGQAGGNQSYMGNATAWIAA